MMQFTTRKLPFLSRQDIWFYDNQTIDLKANNLFYHAYSVPNDKRAVDVRKVYTTSIDLTKTIDEIKSNLKKKLRGYINKGNRTDFTHKTINVYDEKVQQKILLDYVEFAKEKKLEFINEQWFIAACNSGYLTASQIFFEDKPLVTHVYLNNSERTRLQFSFHLPPSKNMNGQFRSLANRYHHWLDILYFKKNGYKIYDFGGIPVNSMKSLRDFKLSFGGIIEEQYDFIIPRGLYKFVYKLKKF